MSTTVSFNSDGSDLAKSLAPHHIKFALLSLNKTHIPHWLSLFCFITSQIQTLALLFKNSYVSFKDNTPASSPAIKLFIKLSVVGDWLDEESLTVMTIGMILITLYMFKLLGVLIYINGCLYYRRKVPEMAQKYWSIMHTLHPLVMFFWIHTFCLQIIKFSRQGNFENPQQMSLTSLAYFNLFTNFFVTLPLSFLFVIFRTKFLLSSKDNSLQILSLFMKSLIPVLWIVDSSHWLQILILSLSLLSCLFHDWIFLRRLPYYHIKVLEICAVFQAPHTILALVSLVMRLAEYKGVFCVHIPWLLLAPLGIKGYYYLTWRLLYRILAVDINEEKNMYYLVHKTFVLQYCLKKRRIVHGEANNLKIYDVLYQGKLKKMAKDLEINFEEIGKDKEKMMHCIKAICLRITKKFPQSMLAQMNLAYIYSKFDSLYLISNTLIQAISAQDPSYQAQISISLLRVDLQRRLTRQFCDQGLNIENYIINQELNNQFKREIDKQVNFQLEFWKGFVATKPQMSRLMKISWRVEKQKGIVRKLWGNLLKIRPNTLTSPLIVYGMYASLANNNTIEGEKYLEYSNEETKRLRKMMKVDELNNNTLFYEKTVQIIMSGLKSKLGRILYTSGNINQVFGWQSSETIEKPINFLMTQFYAKRHDKFLKIHYKTGKVVVLNNTNLVPVKTANGFIRPSWMHVKVNPFVELGISYIALLRPSRSEKRMVLVTKDGKIDGMSREFAKEMNVANSGKDNGEWNILNFCPEFRAVNKAFNSMADSLMSSVDYDGNNSSVIETGTATATGRMNTSIFDKSIGIVENNTSRITERPLLHKGSLNIETSSRKTSPEPIAMHHLKNNFQENKIFTSLEIKADMETSPKSQENFQTIYEKFSMQGSKLVFYPRRAYETSGNKISLFNRSSQSEGLSDAIAYNVQIMNRIYDKEVLKVLILEKLGENNYETDAEMKSSTPNHTSPSTHRVKVEYAVEDNSGLIKKPVMSFPDEIISPQFPSAEPNKRSSLGIFDIINEEKRRSGEAGISLSILDEIQSDDSHAKKAVPRKIIGERNGASPRKDLNLENQMKQNSRFSQLTDDFELSFNQNLDRQGEESPKIWTLNSVTRRSAVDFSQQQFLNILEEKRGSIPKQAAQLQEKPAQNSVMHYPRDSLFCPAGQQFEFPKEEKLLKTKLRKLTLCGQSISILMPLVLKHQKKQTRQNKNKIRSEHKTKGIFFFGAQGVKGEIT